MLEFEERGLNYKQEMFVPLVYKNKRIECDFRIDFLVEDRIVVELKSIENFTLFTKLRCSLICVFSKNKWVYLSTLMQEF